MHHRLVDRWQREQSGSGRIATPLYVAAMLALAIFVVDTFTMLDSAVAVLYAVVIILVAGSAGRRSIWTWSAACLLMTCVGYFYVHGLEVEAESSLRLLVSISAIVATAAVTLRASADRMVVEAQARLLDISSDAIFLRDRDNRIIFWNGGAERLYGWSREEALERDPHDLLRTETREPWEVIRRQMAENGYWEGELAQKDRDGNTIVVLSRWQLQRDRGGRPSTTLESNTDISARRQFDDALRQSEERYRTIFNSLAIGIWEHDLRPLAALIEAARAEGVDDFRRYVAENPEWARQAATLVTITDVNETGMTLLGVASKQEFFSRLDEMLADSGRGFGEFIVALAEGHPTFESQTVVRSRDGREIPVIVATRLPADGAPLDRVQMSILDISARIAAEHQLEQTRRELEQAMRAATMGEVSASIAHEVNQPLSAITTYAEAARRWIRREPPDIEEARQALDRVVAAARHAGEVVKRVRSLLGKARPETMPLPLDAVIAEAVRFVQRDVTRHATALSLDLETAGLHVDGDRILLQQVLINLMVNAMQAMEDVPADTRRLSISTWPQGDSAVIEITDTGPGFPPEVAEKAFQAFFTTKPEGMGLGLSMCRSIIEAHGGSIALGEAAGAGATLTVRLPVLR